MSIRMTTTTEYSYYVEMKKPSLIQNEAEHVSEKLKHLREDVAGLTMEEMAHAMGYKGASSYQYYEDKEEFRGQYFKPEFLSRLKEILIPYGIDARLIDDLGFKAKGFAESKAQAYNSGPAQINEKDKAISTTHDGHQLVVINEYNVELSAGSGCFIDNPECIVAKHYFPLSLLREKTSAPPDKIIILPVRGDSMEPGIPNKSKVLIDMTQNQRPLSEGIYAIEEDGDVKIKRIQFRSDRLYIVSDNKTYDSYESKNARIIGKALELSKLL